MSSTLPRLSRALAPRLRTTRPFSTITRRRQSPVQHIPYVESCPAPTCACAPTPAGLDIDRKTPLLNTMAPYAEQVLICTGKEDWTSNLEDDTGAVADFVKGVKRVIGRGGEKFDPFNNILLTASSLPASTLPNTTTALLFPSFTRLEHIPHTPTALHALASAYLAAPTLHAMHAPLSPSQKAQLTRTPALASLLPEPTPVTNPTILICGHASRDSRCGILGPLLADSFRTELTRVGVDAHVAQISHIGGHKYAGNVVVYIPPGWVAPGRGKEGEGEGNELGGCGVWYGRVGMENVEGLVQETIIRGRVVGELLRGGVKQGGGDLGRRIEAQRRAEGGEEDGNGRLRLRPRARGLRNA